MARPPNRRLALVSGSVTALCIAAVIGAVWYRSAHPVVPPSPEQAGAAATPGTPAATRVTVTASACDPAELSVTSGANTFEIVNRSDRSLEWEILDGVMVVEERENIAPGFTQKLTTRLKPGEYQITCGLLSNPRGRLHVAAGATSEPQAKKPSMIDLIGPIAEYKVYVTGEVEALAEETTRFTDAIKAGDLAAARALYAPARVHYERIEPVAELFSDLDHAIDARADYFEKREADAGFTGFHRLEYGLFAQNSTAGLSAIADRLNQDVAALAGRIHDLTPPPDKMVGGAAALIEEVAGTKLSGEEDRYSHTDLSDFSANLDGAEKIVELMRPLTERADPKAPPAIAANFAAVRDILNRYRLTDGTFKPYDQLSEADRTALKAPLTKLSEELQRLRGILDLA